MEKLLFGSTEDAKKIEKNGMLWNASYGMLLAVQSVVLLMIIKRMCGLEAAGVFSIANANASLMYAIGRYGMRNYQVSDVREQYTFFEYLWSRIFTSAAMIVASVLYGIYGIYVMGYSDEKFWVVVLYCLLRVIDAFEDVYAGFYQQKGRLDVGGRMMTIRLTFTIILMTIALFPGRDMIVAFSISLAASVCVSIYFLVITYRKIGDTCFIKCVSVKKVARLLVSTFPLFAGAFLALYIDNVEKYAIDAYMDEAAQACYNFIFMPVFVVALLSGFIFQPIIGRISVMWKDRDIRGFIRASLKQLFVILGITVIILAGAYVLGIPILSILYATDLSAYKWELMVLLLGGTGYAIGVLFVTLLTIMRRQAAVIYGYLATSVLARILSKSAVINHGVMGASVVYTATMAVGVLIFLIFIVFYIAREGKR